MGKGKVYLIGAGPGDPGLLTLKAKECLEQADVIVSDHLANKKFLLYAKEGGEIIYAGKEGGKHTLSQEEINQLLIEKANQGKLVARLKGGDPFVFGRGGEEAQELSQRGIPFEVVPGVTSAIAVPAYAGIPLTHRKLASSVAFITGHEDPRKKGSTISWDKIATAVETLVFLMGVKNLPAIIENLVKNGRSLKTPAALIRWGTTLQQETLTGTLENIVSLAKETNFKPPAILVVGKVVKLREKLQWFEKKPLFGKKIVVTRSREQASDFTPLLHDYGAEVMEFPTIKVIPPQSWKPLDSAISHLEKYHWIIFTSVNGVRYFLERLKIKDKDIRELKGIKLAAIGPATARELEKLGLKIDLVPSEYRAEAIVAELDKIGIKGKRILLPRARIARDILPEKIKEKGGEIEVVEAYQTIKSQEKVESLRKLLLKRQIDLITFTSSSTVTNFKEKFEGEDLKGLLEGVVIACIGPITVQTAEKLGFEVKIIPQEYTIPALAQAIKEYFTPKGRKS